MDGVENKFYLPLSFEKRLNLENYASMTPLPIISAIREKSSYTPNTAASVGPSKYVSVCKYLCDFGDVSSTIATI